PDDGPVELHFVDLASTVEVFRRVRIGDVKHLIRTGRHAKRRRRPDVGDGALERPVVVEHLDALVASISSVDIALRLDGHRRDIGEHAGIAAARSPRLDEYALAVELRHARVAHAVGDEDIASGIPGDVSRTVEHVALRAATRQTSASTSAAAVAT